MSYEAQSFIRPGLHLDSDARGPAGAVLELVIRRFAASVCVYATVEGFTQPRRCCG